MLEEFGDGEKLGEEWEVHLDEFRDETHKTAEEQRSSKAQWVKQHWNSGTKQFFSAIRPPQKGTYVPSCFYKKEDGRVQSSKQGRQHLPFAAYYQDLSKPVQAKQVVYWARHLSQLSETASHQLDALFTEEEVGEAVAGLALGKSHGIDGFSGELYKELWEFPWFRVAFRGVMNATYEAGYTPSSWSKMIVAVIYKKGDPGNVKKYRPIAITCVDYKLQSRMLATRLGRHMGSIISKDQVGFMSGRLIHENIGIVQGILEAAEGPQWSHTNETGITLCPVCPQSSSPISILTCGDVHPHPGPPSEVKDLEQSGGVWGKGTARVGGWVRRLKSGDHQHFQITVVIDDLIKAVRKGKVVPLHSKDVSSGKWEFLTPLAPAPPINGLELDVEDGPLVHEGVNLLSSASGARARPRPRLPETPLRTIYSPSPIALLRQAKLDSVGDEDGEQGLSEEELSEGEEEDKPLMFFDVAGIEGEVSTPELTRHAGEVMGTLPTIEWGSKSAWTCISWNSRGGAPPPKELKDYFRKEGVGVIGIQETRTNPMKGWGKAAVFCSPGAPQQGGIQTVIPR